MIAIAKFYRLGIMSVREMTEFAKEYGMDLTEMEPGTETDPRELRTFVENWLIADGECDHFPGHFNG